MLPRVVSCVSTYIAIVLGAITAKYFTLKVAFSCSILMFMMYQWVTALQGLTFQNDHSPHHDKRRMCRCDGTSRKFFLREVNIVFCRLL